MYDGATVAVVVTAYEEADLVSQVVHTVPTFVDRIYVVDDASPDDSWSVIQRTARQINDSGTDPRTVVPIRHERNRGYGGAVKTGYRRAVADDMDVVAVMNGDRQMDPAILDRIVQPVAAGTADYAKGNRLLSAEDRTEMSTFRLAGNVVLSGLSKFATGYWSVSDPQNGYTAISSDAIEQLTLDRLTDEYGFLNDILLELNVQECRVVEVPMSARYDRETSTIRLDRFVTRVSLLLFRNFLWRTGTQYLVRGVQPAALYYLIGGLGLVGGVLTTLLGGSRAERAAGVTTVVVAVLSLAMGIERDATANAHLQGTADRDVDLEVDQETATEAGGVTVPPPDEA